MFTLLLLSAAGLIGFQLWKKQQQKATSKGGKNQAKKDGSRAMIKALRVSLLVVTGLAIFLNTAPYIQAVASLFSVVDNRFLALLVSIPFFFEVAGVFVWLVLQILELLPEVLKRDLKTVEIIINNMEQSPSLHIRQSDHPLIQNLKAFYNDAPTRWFRTANTLKNVAYCADFLICIFRYPPIQGGFDRLGVFLAAPSLRDIDMGNIAAIVVTMFTIEAVYKCWQWLEDHERMTKGGKDSTYSGKSADNGNVWDTTAREVR